MPRIRREDQSPSIGQRANVAVRTPPLTLTACAPLLRAERDPDRTMMAKAWQCILPLLCAAALLLAATARAEEPPAPLVVANRTVFVFRATMLGHTPTERAGGAKFRLHNQLERDTPGKVSAHTIEQGVTIDVDGVTMFAITPADIDEPAGATLQTTTENAVYMLQLAIDEFHEREDGGRILRAVGLALLTTAIYVLVLNTLVRVRLRAVARLSRAISSKVAHRPFGGLLAFNTTRLLVLVRLLVNTLCWLLALLGLNLLLTFVLELFPYTRPWGEEMNGFLRRLLLSIGRQMLEAVPDLITVVVIVVITRFVSHLLRAFFVRVRTQHLHIGWLDEETARPTERIAVVVLWLFALVMAYPYLPGANTDAFKGVSVLLGIMVSLGASGIVSQMMSGLILMYSRPLRLGDYVKIGDVEGTVTVIGVLTTRLKNGLGEEIVVPNVFVMSTVARNFSQRDITRRRHVFAVQVGVTIGYSTPWRQVHALLLDAARSTPGLQTEPAPFVTQTALSDFYVEYRLVCYSAIEDPAERALLVGALNANVLDVFNLHGVQIMSPHYVGDPALPLVVPPEKWFEPPAQKPDS